MVYSAANGEVSYAIPSELDVAQFHLTESFLLLALGPARKIPSIVSKSCPIELDPSKFCGIFGLAG